MIMMGSGVQGRKDQRAFCIFLFPLAACLHILMSGALGHSPALNPINGLAHTKCSIPDMTGVLYDTRFMNPEPV